MAPPLPSKLGGIRAVGDKKQFCPKAKDFSVPGVRVISEEVEKSFDDLPKASLIGRIAVHENAADGPNEQFDRWIVLSQALKEADGSLLAALSDIDGHPNSVTYPNQRKRNSWMAVSLA